MGRVICRRFHLLSRFCLHWVLEEEILFSNTESLEFLKYAHGCSHILARRVLQPVVSRYYAMISENIATILTVFTVSQRQLLMMLDITIERQ